MFNTTDFLLKRQSAHTGLDEQAEIVFTKPQRVVRKRPVGVMEAVETPGPVTMGRQTMVHQQPRGGAAPAVAEKPSQKHITKAALIIINAMVLVFIGFLSFVPLGE
ncbi:MAG: hypothetical protein GWN18_07365, partial [Thermoplasmata archaeon]|nr:hypothetical protein [Thermoplasmata archaeon]NIT76973.1 hypothetical protein [Thermoplasmata archaeon]NIU48893.1 hypothetical protein [Thermoplasmata archaeon]NIV78556.1 hypothetical protein [Thermoplasmata archaeon]NIW82385.1 hypothetical protein [Thermoplasmata archaeon]